MSTEALTILSGVVLLLVLALVGWKARRRRDSIEPEDGGTDEGKSS